MRNSFHSITTNAAMIFSDSITIDKKSEISDETYFIFTSGMEHNYRL